jgi:hypothetical protein
LEFLHLTTTEKSRSSMDRDPHPLDPNSLPQTYGTLVNLWTSGVRDYHSLLSDYLTANSIVVAAIGFILARQPPTLLFTFLGMILCVFGVLMVLQMAIVLGRFSPKSPCGNGNSEAWNSTRVGRTHSYLSDSSSTGTTTRLLKTTRTIHRSYARPGYSANTGNGGPVASSAFPYFSGLHMSCSWCGV